MPRQIRTYFLTGWSKDLHPLKAVLFSRGIALEHRRSKKSGIGKPWSVKGSPRLEDLPSGLSRCPFSEAYPDHAWHISSWGRCSRRRSQGGTSALSLLGPVGTKLFAGIRLWCWSQLLRQCNHQKIQETWLNSGVETALFNPHSVPFGRLRKHYNMLDYITQELPAMVAAKLPLLQHRLGIMGHSMGGHGALVAALLGSPDLTCPCFFAVRLVWFIPNLSQGHPTIFQKKCLRRYPELYRSVSAFSPIVHPTESPWGQKAFGLYLGEDPEAWKEYDALELLKRYKGPPQRLLVDQGRKIRKWCWNDFLILQAKLYIYIYI